MSCFKGIFDGTSCHANGPSGHPVNWDNPDKHGAAAKSAPGLHTGFSTCQICHGQDFSGGLVGVSCYTCHGVNAPHPPAPWRGTTRRHTNTNTQNASVCAICHRGQSSPPAPPGTPSGCFNNTLCHGNVGAPHQVPFTDPALHKPEAKKDLTYSQQCHADNPTGGPGSNPRFNVQIGSLTAGCESPGCHLPYTAHAVDTNAPEGWIGHSTAGNMSNACTLCHGIDLTGGANAPGCFNNGIYSCHRSNPLTNTNCTSCHGYPPDGTTPPNTDGSHTAHFNTDMTNAFQTQACDLCHNKTQSTHADGNVDVVWTNCSNCHDSPNLTTEAKNPTYSPYPAWGTKLNSQCDMCHYNPPTASTLYNHNNVTPNQCSSCHPHQATRKPATHMNNTLEPTQVACNTCHGYPPLTNGSTNDKHAPGATPVNHDKSNNGGATLLANHNECQTCHGTKDDGTGHFSSHQNYDPNTMHANGKITMNGPSPNTGAGYNATNNGCDNACHSNDANHQLSSSGLTVEYGDFGTGGGAGGGCISCHTGVPSGATYVTRDVVGSDFQQASRHVMGGTVTNWDCIVCHAEGDANAAANGTATQDSVLHHNGGTPVVDLRNVDNPSQVVIPWDKNNITPAMEKGLDDFCMTCHDANGASGIAVASTNDRITLNPSNQEALAPFNDTDGGYMPLVQRTIPQGPRWWMSMTSSTPEPTHGQQVMESCQVVLMARTTMVMHHSMQ